MPTGKEAGVNLTLPPALEAEIEELLARYPQKRSASLMVLHAMQEHLGYLPQDAVEWAARRLQLPPINLYELVTFYPMFRQRPGGKYVIKICRTLSCALAGSADLHAHLCRRLGLDPHLHGLQTTPDGRFGIEFVECLADCGSAPVLMWNDVLHEGVTREQADALLDSHRDEEAPKPDAAQKPTPSTAGMAAEHGFEP
jgi:NADH-quinone oxidoreductase subunit E